MFNRRSFFDRAPLLIAFAFALVGIICYIDFVTGLAVRTYPLYYAPVALSAWHGRRRVLFLVVFACTFGWLGSNYLVGDYVPAYVWAINTLTQAVSFSLVGGLMFALRKRMAEERTHAQRDGLTGLLNAAAFSSMVGQELSRAQVSKLPVTFAYLDLDNFKLVNDQLGHARGDDALRASANALMSKVRQADICGRLGGDEFGLMLVGGTEEVCRTRLLAIHGALNACLREIHPEVSVSIGAAWHALAPERREDLFQIADGIMYASKRKEKGQLQLVRWESGGATVLAEASAS